MYKTAVLVSTLAAGLMVVFSMKMSPKSCLFDDKRNHGRILRPPLLHSYLELRQGWWEPSETSKVGEVGKAPQEIVHIKENCYSRTLVLKKLQVAAP